MSNIAAIILGRKGSKGVKDKNTMIIEGIPSYEYSFLAAQNSKFINQVFVSSDHDDILNAAIEKKFFTIKRPKYLSTDKALFEDALVHAYKEVKKRNKLELDYIVVLMCNSITINSSLIDQGIELLNFKSHKDDQHRNFYTIGASHVAFTVNNIEELYKTLSKNNIKFNAPPQKSPDGLVKVTFCNDPDGTPVELVQVLDPSIIEKTKN